MATELGQAYVQIMPSAKGISGSIQKELGGEATSAGKSAGGMIGTAIKGAITVAAIGKFIGESLKAGGDLQQSLGGVETLFKENADKVKQYATEAYKTTGLSANDYMSSVTSFSASLLQSLGGDTEKAADKADTAMIDMSDNANKMGTSMESIQTAYQGFAKQNYTMLDNLKLGYGGTKTEMERLLTDAEKLTGVKYDINNLADVYDAIHAVQGELGITGTTAKESAETLSGSFASMKSSFTNFMGNLSLGQDVGPSLKALAETVSTFLFGNFLPMIGNILKALPGGIITFIQTAGPLFLEAGTGFISNLVTGVTAGLPGLLEKGKEIVTNLVNGIVEAIPSIIESAGNIITTFVEFIMENLPKIIDTGKELLVNLVKGIIDNLPEIIASAIKIVGNLVSTILEHLPSVIAAGVSLLVELVGGIISSLPKLIAAAVTLVVQFIGMIVSKFPDIIGVGKDILGSIVSGIGEVASKLYDKGKELMDKLVDKINEWKDKFKTAGSNIVSSIAEGITGAIGKVKGAIGTVAEKIRGYLPFSPAKEGPLKDLNKLNFGGTISESIYNAKRPVTKAMDDLTKSMMSDFNAGDTLDMSMSSTKSGFTNKINHGGTIRVEGVNNRNELMSVVDIVMDELRREVRA